MFCVVVCSCARVLSFGMLGYMVFSSIFLGGGFGLSRLVGRAVGAAQADMKGES